MKKICIRVDGNEIIATGHVMRCLSIAVQLRKIGADVVFVLADARPASIIEDSGFAYIVLDSIWNDMETEIKGFADYLTDNQIKTVLLDSYFVTEKYLQALSKIAKVCYIDDLDKFIYPVHTIINYSLQCNKNYEKRYFDMGYNTKFLLGGKYVPLREEFDFLPYDVRRQVGKVMITTGGTDRLNITTKIIERIMSNPELRTLEYHIIVGRFNMNKDVIMNVAKPHPNIVIHENTSRISYFMRECDVAISAAGTTTFELTACGIPSICLEIADNQNGAVVWEDSGCMLYAGNAYKNQLDCLKQCEIALEKLCSDYKLRVEMSNNMQKMVDGKGAKRIAEYLIAM